MPTTPGQSQPPRRPPPRRGLTREQADQFVNQLSPPELLTAAELATQLGMACERWHNLFDPLELEWLSRVRHRLDVIAEHHQ